MSILDLVLFGFIIVAVVIGYFVGVNAAVLRIHKNNSAAVLTESVSIIRDENSLFPTKIGYLEFFSDGTAHTHIYDEHSGQYWMDHLSVTRKDL